MVHCFVGATGNWSGQYRAPATESVATRARQRISISCRDPQALQARTSPRPLIYRAVWVALLFQACSWSTPQATSRLRSLTKHENPTTRIAQSPRRPKEAALRLVLEPHPQASILCVPVAL